MPKAPRLQAAPSKHPRRLSTLAGLMALNGLMALTGLMALAGLIACGAPGEGEPNGAVRPNVVLIVLDTTRADILSPYGYSKPTSPALARVAAQGVLFRQAMSTDFWTLPSHASLLTGKYPVQHQATSETNRLDEGIETLAESLHGAGYRTRAYVSNAWLGAERGFGQGFETYIETWKSAPGDYNSDKAGIEGSQAWIETLAEEEEPFFLFLNLNSAHMPYSPDPSTLVGLSPGPRPIEKTRELREIKGMWAHLGGAYALGESDFEILEDLYAAEVARVDQLVGQLVSSLDKKGILDRTLLIITADHGENLGEHGMVDHLLSMYEPTIRVPLIMRYPPTFPASLERDELVSLVDIMPTVLDICGLDAEDDKIAGISLASPDGPGHEFVIAENGRPINGIDLMKKNFPLFDTGSIDHRMKMLRTPRHKLIWYDDERVELYDLESDPEELHDLATEDPALKAEMLGQLRLWVASQESLPPPKPLEITDPDTQERLRALGYIE